MDCYSKDTTKFILYCGFVLLSLSLFALTVPSTKLYQYIKLLKQAIPILPSQHFTFFAQLFQTLLMSFRYSYYCKASPIPYLQEYLISVQYSTIFYYFSSVLYTSFTILKVLRLTKPPLIICNLSVLLFLVLLISWENFGIDICLSLQNYVLLLSLLFFLFALLARRKLSHLAANKNLIIDDYKTKQFW
jgi:hypothetical protein